MKLKELDACLHAFALSKRSHTLSTRQHQGSSKLNQQLRTALAQFQRVFHGQARMRKQTPLAFASRFPRHTHCCWDVSMKAQLKRCHQSTTWFNRTDFHRRTPSGYNQPAPSAVMIPWPEPKSTAAFFASCFCWSEWPNARFREVVQVNKTV